VAVNDVDEHTTVIAVRGELDLATAPRLKWPLVDAVDSGRDRIIVDLAAVTFMDSTALGVLIGARRSLGPHAQMAIVCTNPDVLKIFEISGLDVAFRIFPSCSEGLEYLQEDAAR
jgi:anti-sigma B factor antagonist